MLALDLKRRLIVVEVLPLGEGLRRVTAHTGLTVKFFVEHVFVLVRMAPFAEAAAMPLEHIDVAFARRLCRKRELARLMALVTLLGNILVGPRKLESGIIVIKLRQLLKAVRVVTVAAGTLLRFRIKLLLMDADVTVAAEVRIASLVEIKLMRDLGRLGRQLFFGRLVTLHALIFKLLVLARDLERGQIVIEGQALRKVGGAVTLRAGQLQRLLAKLLFMHRSMAAYAKIFLGVRKLKGFLAVPQVAVLTGLHLVLTGQRKARLLVKGAVGRHLSLHVRQLPALGGVTLGAGDSLELSMEGLVVRRFVANFTGLLFELGKLVLSQSIRRDSSADF